MNSGLPFGYLVQSSGSLDLLVVVPMFLGAWSWTIYYDTIYAHQDKEFDAMIGVKSTALT